MLVLESSGHMINHVVRGRDEKSRGRRGLHVPWHCGSGDGPRYRVLPNLHRKRMSYQADADHRMAA